MEVAPVVIYFLLVNLLKISFIPHLTHEYLFQLLLATQCVNLFQESCVFLLLYTYIFHSLQQNRYYIIKYIRMRYYYVIWRCRYLRNNFAKSELDRYANEKAARLLNWKNDKINLQHFLACSYARMVFSIKEKKRTASLIHMFVCIRVRLVLRLPPE